jgi:hypothetical protein
MTEYLVIAIYEDDHTRFATTVEALDEQEAETLAQAEASGPLIVAAVIVGKKMEVVA